MTIFFRQSVMIAHLCLIIAMPVQAEVVFDGTMRPDTLGLTLSGDFEIGAEFGQQMGGNLFHSFERFNINTGERATFTGPDSINNVFSRVTGGHPSNIDGILRSTIPNADVYLTNPWGIMFGPNASIDVQGSFHASTADTLRFSDGGEFNARQPSNTLLTVAPVSAFGFLTDTPAAVTFQDSQLSVPENQTISIIGGELRIINSELSAPSGQLNLASLASDGEIIPSALFSTRTQGGLITVKNSLLTVSGNGSSGIFIRGGNFELINSDIDGSTLGDQNGGPINILVDRLSLMEAANIVNHTHGLGNAGNIKIQTADALTLSGFNEITRWGSSIMSYTFSEEDNAGHSGRIEINAYKINLTDRAEISTGTFGAGNSNNIFIKVADSLNLLNSLIASVSLSEINNAGHAGNIYIEAHQINLTDKAEINGNTLGAGNGADIFIKVADSLNLLGRSMITSSSLGEIDNTGHAGNIEIEARRINLTNVAQIASSTLGSGNGGTIKIKVAETFTISGADGDYFSGVFGDSQNEEIDNAGHVGNIEIEAHQLILTDGATIRSDTWGTGQGGTITLSVDHLEINNSADISGSTWGAGQGTSIIINASTLSLSNGDILSETEQAGNAGSIEIKAHQISLTEGAKISASTFGTGNSGTVIIKIDETLTLSNAGIYSLSASDGNAGHIEIDARQIIMTGASSGINTLTLGSGKGGTIIIRTDILTLLDGGVIFSNSDGTGKGGRIEINAEQITLSDTTRIDTSTLGAGDGGVVIVKTDDLTLSGEATIGSRSGGSTGEGGRIEINAEQVTLSNTARIDTSTYGSGEGGMVVIKTDDLTLSGYATISSGSLLGATGKGGGIEINAEQVTLSDKTLINTSTFGSGEGGMVVVKTDDLTLSGEAKILSSSFLSTGKGGEIEINAEQVTLSNTARLDSSTFGGGEGGVVVVKTDDLTLSGDATISSRSFDFTVNAGNAGNLSVQANNIIRLLDGGKISTETNNAGGGNINIITPNLLYLREGNITTSVSGGTGDGGNIDIKTPVFVVLDGAKIIAQADEGRGGNITIDSDWFWSSTDAPNIVDASSQQNVSGTVEIVGSEDDIIGTIKLLPATFFNAETLLKSQCGALTRRDLSSIVVVGRATRPTAPDDLKTHVIQVTDVYRSPSGALTRHKKSQHSPQRILRVDCAGWK